MKNDSANAKFKNFEIDARYSYVFVLDQAKRKN